MKRFKWDSFQYHYIYKIERFDGAYYIGMHSTNDLDDGYFGSGKRLWHSINYHGKDKHTKNILEFCQTRTHLVDREKEIVNLELLGDPKCLNLKPGGGYLYRATESEESRIRRREAVTAFYSSDKSKSAREKISRALKGRKVSDEVRSKLKIAAKARMEKILANPDEWERIKQLNREKHLGKKQSDSTKLKRVKSLAAAREKNEGKFSFSSQAKKNSSNALKGNQRRACSWKITSLGGNENLIIANLNKWITENKFTRSYDKEGNSYILGPDRMRLYKLEKSNTPKRTK